MFILFNWFTKSLNFIMATLQKIVRLFYIKSKLEREQVELACKILNKSGVIALPTDTLYGLAAKVNDSKALEKIYKIKGRDTAKPLAVCIESLDRIGEVADIGKTSISLINSLLPGPITIVLNRSKNLNSDINPGVNAIGVRMPVHNFILALCSELGPLALTSANKSGAKSPLTIEDFEDIWEDIDLIFDSGQIRMNVLKISSTFEPNRTGSTVIDLTDQDKFYKIIREGCALNRTISILTRFGYRKKRDSQ